MTRRNDAERQEAIERLREWIEPGDTVYTILRHVSRSGMQRRISVVLLQQDGDRLVDLMDMGFHLVYELSRVLFPDGFGCIGKGCPSNDHSNGDRDYTPHRDTNVRCVTWHDRAEPELFTDSLGTWGERDTWGKRQFVTLGGVALYLFDDEVDNDEPTTQHWHKDGGYALRQRWL